MIGSILQTCVLLNFTKVSRKTGDYSVEEMELLKRKRGGKFNQVCNMQINEDNFSEKLFLVSEYEPSYAYISPFIEMTKRKIYTWSGNMVKMCVDSKIRSNYK